MQCFFCPLATRYAVLFCRLQPGMLGSVWLKIVNVLHDKVQLILLFVNWSLDKFLQKNVRIFKIKTSKSRNRFFPNFFKPVLYKSKTITSLQPGLRIRIRIGSGFSRVSGSGSRRAKITHKSRIFFKVYVLKCWKASFEIWRLLL